MHLCSKKLDFRAWIIFPTFTFHIYYSNKREKCNFQTQNHSKLVKLLLGFRIQANRKPMHSTLSFVRESALNFAERGERGKECGSRTFLYSLLQLEIVYFWQTRPDKAPSSDACGLGKSPAVRFSIGPAFSRSINQLMLSLRNPINHPMLPGRFFYEQNGYTDYKFLLQLPPQIHPYFC